MIKIAHPLITTIPGDGRKLSAALDVDGKEYELWFSVDAQYGEYLCDERCDAFVLGVFYFAMCHGHDIIAEAPMTDRLYRQLTDQFFLPFCKLNNLGRNVADIERGIGYRVNISCPLAPEVNHPNGGANVGTGISCGVDSLHVFATHKDITHACIWHAHAMTGIPEMDTPALHDIAWNGMRERALSFTRETGIELVIGDTNFAQGCMPELRWDGMTTFGNLFCIFALQKFWKCYYVASDCDIMNFNMKMKSLEQDPARWEYFLFPHLSLSNLSVYMDGQAHRRVEKVRDIIDYPPAQKYLNVCWRISEGHQNGTNDCPKCMQTLLDLEVFDAVDKFKNVFDVKYYHAHFHEYLAEYYRRCLQKDNFALELKPYMEVRKYPLSVRLKAWLIVLRKAIKKIMRGGKTRQGRFSSKG